jgi:hypothetical protein
LSDEIKPTPAAPEPPPKKTFAEVLTALASNRWAHYLALLAIVSILGKLGVILPPPTAPDIPIFFGEDAANKPAAHDDERQYFGGWVAAPAEVEKIRSALPNAWFGDTPAGKVALGDDDVFLWRTMKQVLGRNLDPRNQGQVGSCVGNGTASAADFVQLVQIAGGANLEFKRVSVEGVYSLSRVEVGGGRISGDGSVGSWAAEAVKRYGVLPMENVLGHDLTNYSESRCRDWGRKGLPNDLEPEAKKSPVRSYTFCKTTDDVDRALAQAYPIAICSDLGVNPQRDVNGFARWDRSWAHCMCLCGKRTDIPGYFIWNSWGDGYHKGPVGPGEPPAGGFWLKKADLSKLLSSRNTECIAFSDAVGFPARKLDWLVHHQQNPNFALARNNHHENRTLFARPAGVRDLLSRRLGQ